MSPQSNTDPTFLHEPIPLRAGPLHLLYDHGMLRSICLGSTEIVRRIYMALRDEHWNTIPYVISKCDVEKHDTSFTMHLTALHDERNIRYSWEGRLCGTGDGVITATFTGTAHNSFFSNRIGWCILHPLSLCKESPCTVTAPNGTITRGYFPGAAISPHQPFVSVASLQYPIDRTYSCICTFAGDTFETEDQRNWTDASFKTYSTLSSLPTPVQVDIGSTISQTVSISLSGYTPHQHLPVPAATPRHIDMATLRSTATPRPMIGLGIALHELMTISPRTIRERLAVDHLRLDIDASRPLPDHLAACITAWCNFHVVGMEIALYLTENFQAECSLTAAALLPCAPVLRRILLIHHDVNLTRTGVFEAARKAFSYLPASTHLFTGTDRYFVELNRAAQLETSGGICFSANPQVHTSDDCVIMENLEGLAEVLHNARSLTGTQPVALTPLTLRPRANPHRPQKDGGADTRQSTGFAAAWAAGAVAAIIESGIATATFFSSLTGAEGITREAGAIPYPLYHLFTTLLQRLPRCSSMLIGTPSPQLAALLFTDGTASSLLVANLTATQQSAKITGITGQCPIRSLFGTAQECCGESIICKLEIVAADTLLNGEYSPLLPAYGIILVEFAPIFSM